MPPSKLTRRAVLGAAAGAVAAVCCDEHFVGAGPPATVADVHEVASSDLVEVADDLVIHRRSDWGADLAPSGPLFAEDVKFLLVHHTASSNTVPDPRDVIRQVYGFHTGPAKRWPDVAYNFFVAPDGSVWEGRSGSLDGPIRADASGGNQGFAQLVCLLGDFSHTPPTPAAQRSLTRTLAWLTQRHRLGVHAEATTTFESRGSNKYRAGTTITTPIVSAHRDVTFTLCPGDAAIALLPTWRREVYELASIDWRREGLQRADRKSLTPP